MPHIFADDKPAKARKEQYRYHVREVADPKFAAQDAEHAKAHVDPERWEIVVGYDRTGHEPPFDENAHWREPVNGPKEEG